MIRVLTLPQLLLFFAVALLLFGPRRVPWTDVLSAKNQGTLNNRFKIGIGAIVLLFVLAHIWFWRG